MASINRSLTSRIVVRVDDDEKAVLQQLVTQLLELIEPDVSPSSSDPLAELMNLGTDVPKPDDPAKLRLFPDAYAQDSDASAEFRRYTQGALAELKVANAHTVEATLSRSGNKLTLSEAEAFAWMGTLNDVRLTIGVRLGVTEENSEELLNESHPNSMMAHIYHWLTYLQDSLIHAVAPQTT